MMPNWDNHPLPLQEQLPLMAYLRGYFDESGKALKHKVVCFGGFVNEDWGPFNHKWRSLLRKYKHPHLHLSKDSLRATSLKLGMYAEFIQAIKQNVDHGIVIAVDVEGYMSLPGKTRAFVGGDPHYLAFQAALVKVKEYASSIPDTVLSMVCDDNVETACTCYQMFNRLRQKDPTYRKLIKSISFADDEFYYPLQAADLLCWASRSEAMQRFYGESFSLRRFSESSPWLIQDSG